MGPCARVLQPGFEQTDQDGATTNEEAYRLAPLRTPSRQLGCSGVEPLRRRRHGSNVTVEDHFWCVLLL